MEYPVGDYAIVTSFADDEGEVWILSLHNVHPAGGTEVLSSFASKRQADKAAGVVNRTVKAAQEGFFKNLDLALDKHYSMK